MLPDSKLPSLQRSRKVIAAKVRALRLARRLTQSELAKHLRLSQNRLSEIERGHGSFTAEQFLELLRLFNVTAGSFVEDARAPELELQNSLARLGATHLQESAIVESGALQGARAAVREAVLSGAPRLITALAPALVRHAATLNLAKLHAELHELGLERRLAWVVENTLAALGMLEAEGGASGREWLKLRRRAELPFQLFLGIASSRGKAADWAAPPDRLDQTIRSQRTLEEVKRGASKISASWGILTSLRPEDFAQALRASHAAGQGLLPRDRSALAE